MYLTGGRGYGGPMQPGVFHGYPLKSPKVQGAEFIQLLCYLEVSSYDMFIATNGSFCG